MTAPVEVQCAVCGRPGHARFEVEPPQVVHLLGDFTCELPPRVVPPKAHRFPRTLNRWDDPW